MIWLRKLCTPAMNGILTSQEATNDSNYHGPYYRYGHKKLIVNWRRIVKKIKESINSRSRKSEPNFLNR